MRFFLLLLTLLMTASASAQELRVAPYLQHATPSSIWVLWETLNAGDESRVEWGRAEALGEQTLGTTLPGDAGSLIHEVELTGLIPNTRYHYRVVTGAIVSPIFELVTPALPEAEEPLRIVAVSDIQQDPANPTLFEEIVRDGILRWLTENRSADLAAELDFVLIPGDLVDDGWDYPSWSETFFTPAAPLFARVPFYAVPGNHEEDSDYYFRYMHLPENGSPGFEEHWWFRDEGNIRLIGLDSNFDYRLDLQLAWLDARLEEACSASEIDFVVAELHHPHKSELWLPGEIDYTGDVIDRLERFSTRCGKPSMHLFGHTHGYSRGQSRDHQHLWVNAATAGGNVDYWGEFPQADYAEFSKSFDAWGWVLLEVEAGDLPSFRLRRFSLGNELERLDNALRDDIRIRRDNTPPETPEPLMPLEDAVDPRCLVMRATAFSDPDGDTHQASHWQVAHTCEDFSAPRIDTWSQHENWFFGIDLAAGDDLTDGRESGTLLPGLSYCWRVRYRDAGLVWSDWSAPTPFTTRPQSELAGIEACKLDRVNASTLQPLPDQTLSGGPTCFGDATDDNTSHGSTLLMAFALWGWRRRIQMG